MDTQIDYISLNDLFWVQVKSDLISFGYKELPTNIHFTIAFNNKTSDINLHVTKNNNSIRGNKPQLKIALIDKELLLNDIPSLAISLLHKILKPFNLDEYKTAKGFDLGFISFNNLKESNSSVLLQNEFIDSFRSITNLKKKSKLKIKGNIEGCIETFASSEKLQKLILDNIIKSSTMSQNEINGGVIILEKDLVPVFCIDTNLYTLTSDLQLSDLSTAFVSPETVKQLIWKAKRSLVSVKNVNCYEDIEHLNNPIRLTH